MKNIRVFYDKIGDLKYISHLDMNRVFTRIVKRSGMPIWYTEGFNPHPKLNFALPLALGFESISEIVDIRIEDDLYDCSIAFEKLKAVMPKGLEIKSVSEPKMKVGDVGFASYELTLAEAYDMSEFFALESIIIDKRTKSGTKATDIKPMIKSFSQNGNILTLVLSAGEPNLNPTLVIDAAEKHYNKPICIVNVVRTNVYNKQMQIFC